MRKRTTQTNPNGSRRRERRNTRRGSGQNIDDTSYRSTEFSITYTILYMAYC